jgi:thiol-disulfide isomerase/thioredoxin
MPELDGATAGNTPPLTRAGLKGRVVLVDFWTYSCINCLRSLPYVQGWADKYRAAGLVVLGIHTPGIRFRARARRGARRCRPAGCAIRGAG